MASHKVWRKIAKRERRRQIRTLAAIARDTPFDPASSEYASWIQEQESLESFEMAQIENQNDIENEKWIAAEKIAIRQWKLLQEKLENIRQKELESMERKRLEYEQEQKRIKETKEKLKKIQEENERKHRIFMEKLELFLDGGLDDPPPELLVYEETKPGCEPCPFFTKTACCRFGNQCSRNHRHCGISKVLLATNLFTHFGLENSHAHEYDTDVMLEYEDNDTYKDFKEFYYDVLPEFEKFGKVVDFKVCNNYERHLRGNVYVAYGSLRGALAAWRALHARWYAGRQLALRPVEIHDWRYAICGLQSRRRCPKGRSCNYLHVFKNPDRRFERRSDDSKRVRESRRSWRWSESPETDVYKRIQTEDDRRHSNRDRSRDRSFEDDDVRERKYREHSGRSSERRRNKNLYPSDSRRSSRSSRRRRRSSSDSDKFSLKNKGEWRMP